MFRNLCKLSLFACAAGHAYLSWPVGRQLAASTIEEAHGAPEFDRQSWSGKGARHFIANCGSRTVDGKYEDVPENWVTRGTFAAGQTVDLEITIDVQHMGAHGFRIICTDDQLAERLPPFTDAAWRNLKRNREDPRHMTEFHRAHFEENDWDTMVFIPQAAGNTPNTVQFVVPADFPACNHAVIQWWWKTANSCTPSLFRGQRGKFIEDSNLPECKFIDDCIDGDCEMEQFHNCADVVITGGDSTTSAPSTSVRSGTTTSTQGDATTKAAITTTETTTMPSDTTTIVSLHCHASSPLATDKWCTENCNHAPAFCPPALCMCVEPASTTASTTSVASMTTSARQSSTQPPSTTLTRGSCTGCCSIDPFMSADMDAWCQANCAQGHCPESHCSDGCRTRRLGSPTWV